MKIENLEKYATTGSPEYEKMVDIIAERFRTVFIEIQYT